MSAPRDIGRYTIWKAIGAGGMATVHLGTQRGDAGFSRTVAVKRLNEAAALDPEFAVMLLDEARLAARVRHPNVIPTLDVVRDSDELIIVMEYVHGASVARLIAGARARGEPIPLGVAAAIASETLHGLHAAHVARGDRGEPLGIVHRDVSPHNLLVGIDGVTRVIDFGIAKAAGRLHTTRDGQVKGKLAYMAPEQLDRQAVDARVDVYATAVTLWELLAGKRLWDGDNDGAVLFALLNNSVEPPSKWRSEVSSELDAIVMKALSSEPNERFATAQEFALSLERAVPVATAHEIGQWVETVAAPDLARLEEAIAETKTRHAASAAEDAFPAAGAMTIEPGGATRSAVDVRVDVPDVVVPPRQKKLGGGVVVAGGVALTIVAATGFFAVSRTGRDAAAAAAPMVSAAAAAPMVSAVVPSPSSASPAPSGSTPPPAPSATPSVVSAPPTTSPRPRPVPIRNNCDPPFYVDKTGVKIVKPNCR